MGFIYKFERNKRAVAVMVNFGIRNIESRTRIPCPRRKGGVGEAIQSSKLKESSDMVFHKTQRWDGKKRSVGAKSSFFFSFFFVSNSSSSPIKRPHSGLKMANVVPLLYPIFGGLLTSLPPALPHSPSIVKPLQPQNKYFSVLILLAHYNNLNFF